MFYGAAPGAAPSAGVTVHPDRLKLHNTPATAPGRAATKRAKKAKKSEAKKRYLVKKAKKRRKIVSARKASAPKNKARRENEDAGEGAETSTDGEEDDKGEEEEEEDEEEDEAESVAGPSRLPTPPNFEINGDVEMGEPTMSRGVPVDEIDPEVAEREQRRREKREKREKRDHKRKSRQDEAMTAPGEPVEASEPIDPTDPTDLTSPTAPTREEDDSRPKRPSPPPLEAFPLPRPAPAPDPKILARQGLPLGLSDAVFIDQDLRIPVSELLITRRGTVEKGVGERMGKRLAEIGVEDFFAVQAAILPRLLPLSLIPLPYTQLNDYLISAPTGSGKTLAYAIPIIEILSHRIVTRLRALIVLPTRDLVVQVRETMEALAKGTGLTIGSIAGQHGFAHEQAQLIADSSSLMLGGSSKLDILIATPGRLMDHLASTRNFTLQHLRFLVIDEADRLLNQSFQNWLSSVLSHTRPPTSQVEMEPGFVRKPYDAVAPAWQEAFGLADRSWEGAEPIQPVCQKLLFSATLTRDPSAIASLDLHLPQYFIVQSPTLASDATAIGEHFALPTSLVERMLILPPALKPLNLIHLVHQPEYNVRGALVFTKSVESASRLVKLLEYFEEAYAGGIVVRGYTSEMKASERKRLLVEFSEGKVHLLVCSDLIARGMDLPTVSHVVSYDVPLDMRKYVHRVGRTARAGRAGTAWTLVEKQEGMLKGAGREKKVRKIKVKEEDLAGYKASYEIAMTRLKDFYSRDA